MLELVNVSVAYGHVQALKGVTLSVDAQQIHAVLGANGAGKTTLLRSILGLSKASGKVLFEGKEISGLSTTERVRRGMALVPEGRRLFPDFTVEENLRIGAFNRSDEAAIKSDIEWACGVFPILAERFHQRSSTLSGGEGQMLAISRALLSRPKLLLLDEPSVGLMPIAVTEIFKMIRTIPARDKVTVLLVEQNTRKALSIADTAAVLELGQLVLEGSAAAISADPRVKEAYLGN
jgi:branched-chain amino acid transport system ATP-binding protein